MTMLLCSLLLAGAGPRAAAPLPLPLPLPLPPPLPADPPTDLAAPVPDADLTTPDRASQDQGAFALRVYRMREFGTSDGFIPGSSYQAPEQRKPLQTPGFMVTVPLQ